MSKTCYAGLAVGILSGVWMVTSNLLGFISFAGFLGWSTFYAAGGQFSGLKNTIVSNFSGVCYAAAIIFLHQHTSAWINEQVSIGIIVTLFATLMVWQSKVPLLVFVPGTFIGCCTYFATNNAFWDSVIGLVLGALFGYASQKLGDYWYQMSEKRKASSS